jgi:hypothetical protein
MCTSPPENRAQSWSVQMMPAEPVTYPATFGADAGMLKASAPIVSIIVTGILLLLICHYEDDERRHDPSRGR